MGGSGLVNGDVLSGALATSATTTSNVGGYAIAQGTLVASANYALTYVGGVLTVDARPITVTADGQTRHYGDANPALTYAVGGGGARQRRRVVGRAGDDRDDDQQCRRLYHHARHSDRCQQYELRHRLYRRHAERDGAPDHGDGDDLTRHYGDANPALTYAVGGDGLVNGDMLSGALATSAAGTSSVGNYAVTQGTLAASANYDLTYVGGVLTVDARPITVTADDLTRHYGDANPALTYAVGGGGLVNGDALSGALATTATTTSNVGGYTITQGTLTDANNTNYDIGYTGATLSVTVRPITVTADDLTRHYGDANPA